MEAEVKRLSYKSLLPFVALIFGVGGFVNSMHNAAAMAANHESRIKTLEEFKVEAAAAMKEASETNKAVMRAAEALQRDLTDHKVLDAADTAEIRRNKDEIERLRGRR